MRESTGIDKVEDSVDQLLVEEVDGENVKMSKVEIHHKAGIRDYQQQMKLLLEKMVRQTEGSAEAQRKLQADLRNKKLAHEIDK